MSWHDTYKDSAYIFFAGVPFDVTEQDLLTLFSQFGEIEDLQLAHENPAVNDVNQIELNAERKSKGFGHLKYEDARSAVLAVDNFNGV